MSSPIANVESVIIYLTEGKTKTKVKLRNKKISIQPSKSPKGPKKERN